MNRHVAIGTMGCILAMVSVCGCKQKGNSATPSAQTAPPNTMAPTTRPARVEPAAKPAEEPVAGAQTRPAGPPRVEMRIQQGSEDWGWIIIELDEEKAPITVKNFLRYVDEGYYNGTIFHRIIPTFMIQGGGFKSLGAEKAAGLHEPIQNEAKNGLKNARGTLAMARTGDPHSATAQFFINVADNKQLDYPSFDGWGYAVFGKVVEGMDVVDKIKAVETQIDPSSPRPEKSQPLNPPVITVAQRAK
jgi:cyclophilin family peptidyl-prolyl cis-trans isomerase